MVAAALNDIFASSQGLGKVQWQLFALAELVQAMLYRTIGMLDCRRSLEGHERLWKLLNRHIIHFSNVLEDHFAIASSNFRFESMIFLGSCMALVEIGFQKRGKVFGKDCCFGSFDQNGVIAYFTREHSRLPGIT